MLLAVMPLGRAPHAAEQRHIELGGSAMGRNILVVEDDRNICDLIHMYLVKEGFDVRIAGDGGKAIEEFQLSLIHI